MVMSRDGLVNLIWHDKLRKICDGCIIQRKEKVSWRKEEIGRAKNWNELRKRKSVLQQKSPHLLP